MKVSYYNGIINKQRDFIIGIKPENEYSKVRDNIHPLIDDYYLGEDDSTMFEIYLNLLGFEDLTIVEIGSWLGMGSTRFIAERIKGDSIVYAIDPWDPKIAAVDSLKEFFLGKDSDYLYHQFLSNMCHLNLENNVIPIRGESIEISSKWSLPIDILYIDGNHARTAVISDLSSWVPYVRQGGIICGDDYRIFRNTGNYLKRVLNIAGLKLELSGNGVAEGVRQCVDEGLIKNVFLNQLHWWCVKL